MAKKIKKLSQESITRKNELYFNIIKRSNETLYQNYLDLKEIININIENFGEPNYDEICERLKWERRYISYLLRFDKLEDVSWLDRIPANVILLTVSFNEDTKENQEVHFNHFEKHNYGVEKARIYLIKEYVRNQEEVTGGLSHALYLRLTKMLDTTTHHLNLVKTSTISKNEKKILRDYITNLTTKAEEVLDG